MSTRTCLTTLLAATLAILTLTAAPATAHRPDACGPTASSAAPDAIDAITYRKEQMSLQRANGLFD